MILQYVFFDVAGTLLHKPALARVIREVLHEHGADVSVEDIRNVRLRLAETMDFPVTTTPEFYKIFNARMLQRLGVSPATEIVDEINRRSKEVHWEKYPDTDVLDKIPVPIGIISNWDATLPDVLAKHFTAKFFRITYSAKETVQKPGMEIFSRAVFDIDVRSNNILYVGDSVRLDMLPAQQAGLHPVLIHREISTSDYSGVAIRSLRDVLSFEFKR